jgi:biopolymer transport protein ExbB
MKYIITLFLLINQTWGLNLNTLLDEIKRESNKEISLENQRVAKFLNKKNEQEKILKQTKLDLKKANENTERLKVIIDKNEKILTQKEVVLKTKIGDLGEMFGSVRQTSADFLTNYQNALTASQLPNKEAIFNKYANSKKLPNINELKEFWHSMLEEIIQSGNISTYNAQVVLNDGKKIDKTITRVGQFAAVSDGRYFNYSKDMNSLIELSTQPSSSVLAQAKEFEQSNGEIKNIVIDPTKGTLFELLNNNPTIMDRINQGGIIGYIIIALGIIGLLFAFYKVIILNFEYRAVKNQMKDLQSPNHNNSLGKIAQTFYDNKDKNLNDLEITVSEAILKEVNRVKKGQSFVKLLSAVTPLLGLLGTVTGMIATFQAITLFGTGDPKLMAGGISTALITTVLGLVAAIPLLFSYTYIASKADTIVSILEEQSVGMLAKSLK